MPKKIYKFNIAIASVVLDRENQSRNKKRNDLPDLPYDLSCLAFLSYPMKQRDKDRNFISQILAIKDQKNYSSS